MLNDQSSIFNVDAVPAGNILALAPHPDDFDAIAVTLRSLKDAGREIFLAVATSGDSGVEDEYMRRFPDMTKAEVREAEQSASIAFFGLPDSHLSFLRLDEGENGHPVVSDANSAKISECLLDVSPRVVFLPHWNDTNAAHSRVYAMFADTVSVKQLNVTAYLNRDPKTISMRHNLHTAFVDPLVAWKRELLRFHDSQHQRNLNTREHGFDERVLAVNRQIAKDLKLDAPYAEVFEVVTPERLLNSSNTDEVYQTDSTDCEHMFVVDKRDPVNVAVNLSAKLIAFLLALATIPACFIVFFYTSFILAGMFCALSFNSFLDNRHSKCLKCGVVKLSEHAIATFEFAPLFLLSPFVPMLAIIAASPRTDGFSGLGIMWTCVFSITPTFIIMSIFAALILRVIPKPLTYPKLLFIPVSLMIAQFAIWCYALQTEKGVTALCDFFMHCSLGF